MHASSRILDRLVVDYSSRLNVSVSASSAVRHLGRQDHLQHHARYVPPCLHLRRHRRSALQGRFTKTQDRKIKDQITCLDIVGLKSVAPADARPENEGPDCAGWKVKIKTEVSQWKT